MIALKKTVCILFGGVSSEHEVSLRSAASVLRNLNKERWQVVMLGITKDGRWLRYEGPAEAVEDGSWERGNVTPAILSPDRSHGGLLVLTEDGPQTRRVDVAFGVLHGKNGEDGTMQGLFELAGIPYVGCGVLASAVCMDKAVTHTVLCAAGIPKTRLEAVRPEDLAAFESLEQKLRESLGYPMFVKPANAGSSVGVSRAEDAGGLRRALETAFAHDGKAVVEQQVTGQEVECSVMGNREPVASHQVGEIVPTVSFYTYEAKYLDDTADLLVPARLAPETARQVRRIAVEAYRAAGCEGFARVDFFVREDGGVVLNEINTIPGFTSISMFARLFEESGVTYSQVVDRLLDLALERGGV